MTAVVTGLVDDDYRAVPVGVYPDDCCRSWIDLFRDVKRWSDASNSVFVCFCVFSLLLRTLNTEIMVKEITLWKKSKLYVLSFV